MGIFGNRNDPYKKGNTIYVLWDTGYYYPATVISSIENEVYFKLMGFTDQQWVNKTGTKQAELSSGDMIECRWREEEKFYQAEIMRINGNSLYVKYNDGEKEHTTISMIRLIDDAEERAQEKIDIGDSFYDQEDYNRAIECYKEALEIKGDSCLAYSNIGFVLALMDKHRESIEHFKKGLEIDPNSHLMLNMLGDSYYAIEEYTEAIKCYLIAVELDEDYQLAYLNLGYSYSKIGEYDKSIQYYQTVLDFESNDYNDQVFNGIGDCYYYQSKYRQAIKYFKKAIEVTPDSEHYQNNLKYASDKLAESNPGISDDKEKVSTEISEDPEESSLRNVMKEIHKLIGMENIKEDIDSLMNHLKIERMRIEQGLPVNSLSLHTVFYGPPGTGKTTVARLLGKIFKELGILKKGHVIEVDRTELVAQIVGGTADKTDKVINAAIDGILFIDEAYSLKPEDVGYDFGQEAIDTILKRMEDDRGRLIVIVAGYPDEMERFIESNPGLKSRFNRYFFFKDYKAEELLELFDKVFCEPKGYSITEEVQDKLYRYFDYAYKTRDRTFGNGRFVRNLFEEVIRIQSTRLVEIGSSEITREVLTTIVLEDIEKALEDKFVEKEEQTLEQILQSMNKMVGLENIKKDIENLLRFAKMEKLREQKGLSTTQIALHTVFYGPPGTGKTTIARLIGKTFKALGVLSRGHVVEVDRSKLVADHIGGTAKKTNKVIDSALNGILFIDEAYTLSKQENGRGIDFGQEAIDTLLKRMEDDRDKLIVIVAGYKGKMQRFIESNPGLKSRFNRFFYFEDYEPRELVEIFKMKCVSSKYKLANSAEAILLEYFKKAYNDRDSSFGNGRLVRNILEKVIQAQSFRLAEVDPEELTDEVLSMLDAQDIEIGLEGQNSFVLKRSIGFTK